MKRNYELKRTVWLADVAPTIAYPMDIPPPRRADEAVLYGALEEN